MKFFLIPLLTAAACTGCTGLALERRTVALTNTVADLRYQMILDNFALIADNPAALPTFNSIYAGGVSVQDTVGVSATTLWQNFVPTGFTSQGATPSASRSPQATWTLDPSSTPEKIEAMQCAYRWVLYGGSPCARCASLLADPVADPSPGRHFNVASKLAALPPGWLHVGRISDAPPHACYKAYHGHTWVWVERDGMEGLSQFTLVIQDVGRIDINSPSLFAPPIPVVSYTLINVPDMSSATNKDQAPNGHGTGNGRNSTDLPKKPDHVCQLGSVVAVVDACGNLAPATQYYRYRGDNVGADSFTRAAIATSVSH